MDTGPRTLLGSPGVLGGLAALSALAALFVRAPEGASFSLLVAVNGPRLLLALAAGSALGVAGALADRAGPRPEREALIQAVACGGAVGAAWLVASGGFSPGSGLVLGSLLGAVAFGLALFLLRRTGSAGHALAGSFLALALAAGLVAAVLSKAEAIDRAFVWWWLGDVGGASWLTAGFAAGSVAALIALTVSRARASVGVTPLAFALYGLAFGVAGIVPWLGMMVPLAAGLLRGQERADGTLLSCAGLGALALVWADTVPRLLASGFAPPAGVAVTIVALPWFLVWGGAREREHRARGRRTLRAADYALAGIIGAAGIAAAVVLTFVVRILG